MTLASLLKAFGLKRAPTYTGPRVPIAVIGAGRMGRFHARHLAAIPQARLVGIVDADASRATVTAEPLGVSAAATIDELPETPQAAVIAVPTSLHAAIAEPLLRRGIHCLIEKPLAHTLEEADRLIEAARQGSATLQVGHIERFNPAVMAAVQEIRQPQFIEVNRLGPYDPRVADVGVVLDLMIHDLDIVLFLVGSPVKRVEAFGAKVLSAHEDIAKVRLHFEGGCVADLSASRISMEKYRRIRVFQPDAYISLDYANSSLKMYRKKSPVVKSLLDIQRLAPALERRDPLAAELTHFLDCVMAKKRPYVTGEHGRAAMALAQDVLASIQLKA